MTCLIGTGMARCCSRDDLCRKQVQECLDPIKFMGTNRTFDFSVNVSRKPGCKLRLVRQDIRKIRIIGLQFVGGVHSSGVSPCCHRVILLPCKHSGQGEELRAVGNVERGILVCLADENRPSRHTWDRSPTSSDEASKQPQEVGVRPLQRDCRGFFSGKIEEGKWSGEFHGRRYNGLSVSQF